MGDVYLIFLTQLESSENTPFRMRIVNRLVSMLQGAAPVMSHVELVVGRRGLHHPVAKQSCNYSTYIGHGGSGWQQKGHDSTMYYMHGQNYDKWLAVPVSVDDIPAILDHCNTSCPYSLSQYLTSIYPFRYFSSRWNDEAGAEAHCATLSARVLKAGKPDCLKHCSAWYSPTSLYKELMESCGTNTYDFGEVQINWNQLQDSVKKRTRQYEEKYKTV